MMSPLGASTGSSIIDLAETWRVRVGGDNFAGAGAVLGNGDIVLAGPTGSRGEEALHGPFAPCSASASDYFASRLDAAGGDPLWRREASSLAANDLGDFMLTAVGATSTERTDSEGTGGVAGEAVLLGGCIEDRWNDAAYPEEGSGRQHDIGSSGTLASAVKLNASDGVEIWRFRDAAQGVDGGGGVGCVLGVASDRRGDFFLVGYVVRGSGREMAPPGASRNDIDLLVIKLDGATGEVDWRLQHGTTSDDDVFFAGATDSGDNLIAAGYTGGGYGVRASAAGGRDYFAAKFDPGGEELWRYQNGSAEGDEAFRVVAVNADGDVYLGGDRGVSNSGTSKSRPQVVVVHKLDGASGTLLWTYESNASSKTTLQGVTLDGAYGLVIFARVSGGGSEKGFSLRGGRDADDEFALALVASDTGEQIGTWWPGFPSARVALALAGVGPDGGIALTGYAFSDDAGDAVDLSVVRLPPQRERRLAAPGLISTSAPTSAAGLHARERSLTQNEEKSGAHVWVMLAVVLGALSAVGICILLVAYGWWRRRCRRRKTEENESTIAKTEAASDHPAVPPRTSCSALTTLAGDHISPVQEGGPPPSAPSRGDSPPRMCKVHPHVGRNKVATSAQTASLPLETSINLAPGEATPALRWTSDESDKTAAEGAAAAAKSRGCESGLRESSRGENDLSALASPENYGLFPQPFSDVRMPVHPYSPLPSASVLSGAKPGRAAGHRHARGHSNSLGRDSCVLPTEAPEVDIADLVLDNNDYYARVADESSTLREAAAVVAVAAAATGQGRVFEVGGGVGGEEDRGRDDVGSRASRGKKSAAAVMSPVPEAAEATDEVEKAWASGGKRGVLVQENRGSGGGAAEDPKLEESEATIVATTTIESAKTPGGDVGRNSRQAAYDSCDEGFATSAVDGASSSRCVSPSVQRALFTRKTSIRTNGPSSMRKSLSLPVEAGGGAAPDRSRQKLRRLPSMFAGNEGGGLPPLAQAPRGAAVRSGVLSRSRGAGATARGSGGGSGGRGTVSVIEPLSAIENRIAALSSSSAEKGCSLEGHGEKVENVSDGKSGRGGGGEELSASPRSLLLAPRASPSADGGERESSGEQPAAESPVRGFDDGGSNGSLYPTTLNPKETRKRSGTGGVDRVDTVKSLPPRPSTRRSPDESEVAAGVPLPRSSFELIPSLPPLTRGGISAGVGGLGYVPGCGSGQLKPVPRGSDGPVTFDIDAITEAVGWWGKKRSRCVPTPGDESSGGGKVSEGGGESSLPEYSRSPFFVCGEVVATPPPTESPRTRGGYSSAAAVVAAAGSRCSSAGRIAGGTKVNNLNKHEQPADTE